MAVAKYHMIY